jgi:hypothetical protein
MAFVRCVGGILLVGAVLAVNGCAKETSAEDRKREETDRQFNRLDKATGSYLGYALADGDRITPLELNLSAARNPAEGDDNPALTATLRIGLFGGVRISSRLVSYDWGSGKITASFDRASGNMVAGMASGGGTSSNGGSRGSPLELRGILRDGKIESGEIDGPNSGRTPVELSKTGPYLFSDERSYTYQVTFGTTPAQLDINPLVSPRAAPGTSDLPILPPLEASIRFSGSAIVPQTASDVVYEPIAGFLELQLRADAKIRVDDVFLTRAATQTGLHGWTPPTQYAGQVIQGAAIVGDARFSPNFPGLGIAQPNNLRQLPPRYYSGTYRGSQSAVEFPAIASLEYLNTQGTNSAEYPFPAFPKFRFKVLVCSGGRPLKEGTYDMSAMNPLDSTARLIDTRNTVISVLDMRYVDDWNKLVGRFTSSSSGAIDTRDPQLRVTATNGIGNIDCSFTTGDGDQVP